MTMSNLLNTVSVVHVRVDGSSQDVPLDALDLAPDASDAALKRALARRLELPEHRLRDLVVDRHATGNLTVRPGAVFG
jgi:hypothetical protein